MLRACGIRYTQNQPRDAQVSAAIVHSDGMAIGTTGVRSSAAPPRAALDAPVRGIGLTAQPPPMKQSPEHDLWWKDEHNPGEAHLPVSWAVAAATAPTSEPLPKDFAQVRQNHAR